MALASLLAFFGAPAKAQGDYTTWRLIPPTWENKDKRAEGSGYRIEEVHADARGGRIRLSILGRERCAGRAQRVTFKWTFDRDISVISGKQGDRAFELSARWEGERDGCINADPVIYFTHHGDLMAPANSGEFHFKQEDPFHDPKPRLYKFWLTDRTKEGTRFYVDRLGYEGIPIGLSVYYLFEGVKSGAAGGGFCEEYARSAVEQNRENVEGNCGFDGRRWHSDYSAHRSWCQGVDRSQADSERTIRDQKLSQCGGGGSFCEKYARRAVEQNRQNLERNCGYDGRRWHSDHSAHRSWCEGVDRSQADSERTIRDQKLSQCDGGGTGVGGGGDCRGRTALLTVPNTKPERVQTPWRTSPDCHYVIEASGTVSDWGDRDGGVDPVWCYARWRCGDGEAWQQLRINGKGMADLAGAAIRFNPSHSYTIRIRGTGQPLEFYCSDAQASSGDNKGSFQVRVTEVSP